LVKGILYDGESGLESLSFGKVYLYGKGVAFYLIICLGWMLVAVAGEIAKLLSLGLHLWSDAWFFFCSIFYFAFLT
jgi:hypothetical protein